jgi:hypothetical protein
LIIDDSILCAVDDLELDADGIIEIDDSILSAGDDLEATGDSVLVEESDLCAGGDLDIISRSRR